MKRLRRTKLANVSRLKPSPVTIIAQMIRASLFARATVKWLTQGKIERWLQTLKNRILLDNYYLPGDLETQTDERVLVT